MLESTFELLGDLFFAALALLISSSVVGSIVAAVRAVSGGSATVTPKDVNPVFDFAASTRMTAPTTFHREGKLSEEMQHGWRRAQKLERVGERRIGSKGSR